MTEPTVLRPAPPRWREELLARGAAALDDAVLLTILIGTGSRGRGAETLARALLRELGGAAQLVALSPNTLARRAGFGAARAARIAAGLELGRRTVSGADGSRPPIRSPEDALRSVPQLAEQPREHLVALYLDGQGRLIASETVAVGSLNVARALPRDLLEPALRLWACSLVLIHNHPSGSPEPSDDDLRFTRTVGRAAALLGVTLTDHVIVAREGFVSLRARGIVWEGGDPHRT